MHVVDTLCNTYLPRRTTPRCARVAPATAARIARWDALQGPAGSHRAGDLSRDDRQRRAQHQLGGQEHEERYAPGSVRCLGLAQVSARVGGVDRYVVQRLQVDVRCDEANRNASTAPSALPPMTSSSPSFVCIIMPWPKTQSISSQPSTTTSVATPRLINPNSFVIAVNPLPNTEPISDALDYLLWATTCARIAGRPAAPLGTSVAAVKPMGKVGDHLSGADCGLLCSGARRDRCDFCLTSGGSQRPRVVLAGEERSGRQHLTRHD
jgi:hypothetical protein